MNVYNLYRVDPDGDRIQKTAIARRLDDIPGVDLYRIATVTKFPDGEESIGFIPAAIAMSADREARRPRITVQRGRSIGPTIQSTPKPR